MLVQYGLKRNPLAWFPASFVCFGFLSLFVLRTNGMVPTHLQFVYRRCPGYNFFSAERVLESMYFCFLTAAPLLQEAQNPVLVTKSGMKKKNITRQLHIISVENYSCGCLIARGREVFRRKLECTNGP